jgi:hydrogenase maturation protease
MSRPTPLLVLGLGNVLLRDDGVGSSAVSMLLDRYEPPDGVRVLDGGTLGLSLLPYLEDAGTAILVDAIRGNGPAGTIVRLEGDEVAPAVATRLSVHQVGVLDLLDGAHWRERYPERVVLLGIVPDALDLEVGLTPQVARSMPALVDQVVEEASRLGFHFERRENDEATSAGSVGHVARLPGLL